MLPFWCTDPNCGKFHPKCQTYGHPWHQIVNVPPAGPTFAPPLAPIWEISTRGGAVLGSPSRKDPYIFHGNRQRAQVRAVESPTSGPQHPSIGSLLISVKTDDRTFVKRRHFARSGPDSGNFRFSGQVCFSVFSARNPQDDCGCNLSSPRELNFRKTTPTSTWKFPKLGRGQKQETNPDKTL